MKLIHGQYLRPSFTRGWGTCVPACVPGGSPVGPGRVPGHRWGPTRGVPGQPAQVGQPSRGRTPPRTPAHPTPRARARSVRIRGARALRGDGHPSRNRLQTRSAPRLAAPGGHRLSLKSDPKEDLDRLELHLENDPGSEAPVRARRGKGPQAPSHRLQRRSSSSSRGEGRAGPGRPAGAGGSGGRLREGPSLLPSRGPLLLTFSRSLGSAALARGRAVGPRSGERSRRGRGGPRPSPNGRIGLGRGRPHLELRRRRARWVPRPGGWLPRLCRAPPTHTPPRPATPPGASRRPRGPGDALAPGPPPPLPPPGRRRARSGDVKGRAVAAPPRALVKKKKKRGNET